MMNFRRTMPLLLAATVGCGFFPTRPDVIAERFWDATVDGDYERASEYATSSSQEFLDRNADDAPEFEEVTLGDVQVDGDDATVQTEMTVLIDGQPMKVAFNTVLEREDGEWRVDVPRTSGQLIAQFVGQTAGDFMGQIGQAVGEQLGGMLDGLVKGLADGMGQASGKVRPDSTR